MEEKKETITIKKQDLWKYSTFILLALVIVLAFMVFSDNGSSPATGRVIDDVPDTIPPQTANVEEVIRDDDPVIGDEDATVTIVEFSDFSCPFCAAASGDNEEMVSYMKSRSATWEPITNNVMKDYVESGKVKFVYKYFPGHGSGQQAMLVGWCVNEQDSELFWEFHNEAFKDLDITNDLEKMKAIAKTVGANMNKLDECIESGKYEAKLEADTNDGRAVGVGGTPAFFVNGKLVSGAVPYSQLKQVIDAEL